MNRVLPISALLLSACALVATMFLWREIHLSRLESSRHPLRVRLSDEQLAVVQGFSDDVHSKFSTGTVPRSSVLMSEQLLNKARFMHGDITREEWHRLDLTTGSEYPRLIIARFDAGAGTPPDLSVFYDDLLESSR